MSSTARFAVPVGWLVMASALCVCALPTVAESGADYISGQVRSTQGPEAGVWVIAETTDLPTKFTKIVVTDDSGKYLVPDLPSAHYAVWVRGYGLVDSAKVTAALGQQIDLEATVAPSPQAAAEYYPAAYWYSMLHVPGADSFPGSGAEGNGIPTNMTTQQEWLANLREGCLFCHELGTKVTRTLPAHPGLTDMQEWSLRTSQVRTPQPDLKAGASLLAGFMASDMNLLGRQPALKMFTNWTERIAAGEVPETPERPRGIERNVVITEWAWSENHFIHDIAVSDRRDAHVNANGPVIGVGNLGDPLAILYPTTNSVAEASVPAFGADMGPQDPGSGLHTDTFDQSGMLWTSDNLGSAALPEKYAAHNPCTDGSVNPYAAYFPRTELKGIHLIALYDPKTKKITRIPTCFGSHHLAFGHDKDNTLYFSGDPEVVGWIDTAKYNKTHDWVQSTGWCPFVLDTSGDGSVTPDRARWNILGDTNVFGEGAAFGQGNAPTASPSDPTKDTELKSFPYGIAVAPDGAIWYARWTPVWPSGIFRVSLGNAPPRTCKTEYYEPPKLGGIYKAWNARGVAVDGKGVVWVAFGSGQIGRFDRERCKVRSGPTAVGQQCSDAWQFFTGPGPKLEGVTSEVAGGGTDWYYLAWIDDFNTLGLGRDVPIFPGSQSDSLVAFLPETQKFVELRIPYPMGGLIRGFDGRIDNPGTGWKGRGVWGSFGVIPVYHMEGDHGRVFKIQLRPNPLAR